MKSIWTFCDDREYVMVDGKREPFLTTWLLFDSERADEVIRQLGGIANDLEDHYVPEHVTAQQIVDTYHGITQIKPE